MSQIDQKALGEKAATLSAAVSQRLREARTERGLSIYRLARISGLSERAIDFIEKGERTPSIDTLFRISLALNLNAADLIQRAEAE